MDRDQVQHTIERLKEGDKAVLEHLYKEHRTPFLKFASKYNLSKDELLDIYQDSILAFVDNVQNGKVENLNSSIGTYLFAIGKFMVFKRLKRLKMVDESPIDRERLEYYHRETHDNDAYDDEEIALFKKCFEQLGAQCKELLQLFYYRGFDLEEIQAAQGYDNYNVVKSQKSRCLKHLKTLISKYKNG